MIHLSPGLRAMQAYPFEELDRAVAAVRDAGRAVIDLGAGDPREETPAFIREALAAAIAPVSSYPRAAGLPRAARRDRGLDRIALRRSRGSGHGGPADPRIEGARLLAGPGRAGSGGREGPGADDVAGVPGARARRTVGRRRGAPDAAPGGERLPARPRRDHARSSGIAPRSCGSTTRTTRPGRRRRSPSWTTPRRGAGPRGVVLASDEAYSELWFGERAAGRRAAGVRPDERPRDQHAVEALVDDRLPQRVRGRGSGPDRGAETAAAEHRGDAAGVRADGVRRRLARRAARRGEPRAVRGEAPRVPRGVRAARAARRRERGHVLPVGARARRPSVARVGARAAGSHRRRGGARLVLRAGGRGLRPPRDGADPGGLRTGRRGPRRCAVARCRRDRPAELASAIEAILGRDRAPIRRRRSTRRRSRPRSRCSTPAGCAWPSRRPTTAAGW